jgi:hypothetical protein
VPTRDPTAEEIQTLKVAPAPLAAAVQPPPQNRNVAVGEAIGSVS